MTAVGHSMRRLMVMVLVLAALGPAAAYAEQERGSANYMLPLCRAWLKIVDKDAEAIKDLLRTDAVVRLTAAGMCAGVVIGVLESLHSLELSCPPDGLTNDQLVRMVVRAIESHPETMHEDFAVRARVVMMASWPCRK
jgi:hypothetical protein